MRLAAVARFAALLIAPALSTAAPAQQAASEAGVIAFAPPVDTDLPYTLTIARPRGGTDNSRAIEQVVRFARAGEGYVLKITPVKVSAAGMTLDVATQLDALPATMRPLFLPISYDLDDSGEPLRIRDWDALRARIGPAVTGMTKAAPGLDAQQAEGAAMVATSMYESMTAEIAAKHFLQGWHVMIGYGGVAFTEGKQVESGREVDLGFGPIPLKGSYRITRAPENRLRLVQEETMDRAQAGSMLRARLEQIAAAAGPRDAKSQANLEAVLAKLDKAEITDRLDILLDAATGLPIKGVAHRTMTVPGEEPVTMTTTIERRAA